MVVDLAPEVLGVAVAGPEVSVVGQALVVVVQVPEVSVVLLGVLPGAQVALLEQEAAWVLPEIQVVSRVPGAAWVLLVPLALEPEKALDLISPVLVQVVPAMAGVFPEVPLEGLVCLAVEEQVSLQACQAVPVHLP